MHPLGIYASYLVKALNPPLKYVVVVSSYGWGGGALRQISDILVASAPEMIGALEIKGPPGDADYEKISEIGEHLAKKIRG